MFLILLLLLILKCIDTQYLTSNFSVRKNVVLDSKFHKAFLLDSFNTASKIMCLIECMKTDTCVSCAYDNGNSSKTQVNCYLYNSKMPTYTVSTNSTLNLFNKMCKNVEMLTFDTKCFSLNEVFSKGLPPIQKIGPSNLNNNVEYHIQSKKPHNYYMTNYGSNDIAIFDRNWNYLNKINIILPKDIKIVDNFTYIISYDGFRMFDNNFKQIAYAQNRNGGIFVRLGYSAIYSTFYLSHSIDRCLHLFDENLTYLGNVSLGTYVAFGFNELNGKLYVGTVNKIILVIQNRTIIGNYTIMCVTTVSIKGIYIDYEGYMAVTCTKDHLVLLYHINGTNTGKSFSVPFASFAKFDLNGNFAIGDNLNNLINLYK